MTDLTKALQELMAVLKDQKDPEGEVQFFLIEPENVQEAGMQQEYERLVKAAEAVLRAVA